MSECVCICDCKTEMNDYLMKSNIISIIGVFVTTLAVYYQTKDWKIMILVFTAMIIMALILSYQIEKNKRKDK